MQAEIITIGDELLIGMTTDTNSAWMGAVLTEAGIKVYQVTSISDNREHILRAVDESMSRSEIVLVTGGLGPTSDDITKKTLAGYFGSEMVLNREVLNHIGLIISKRNLEMNENNRNQALVPAGCTVISNSKGTAPGMWFEKNGHCLVSMPGVPYEMKEMMTSHIIPMLKERFTIGHVLFRLIMTYGTFEAKLAEYLEGFEADLPPHIRLAYLPTAGIIKLRLTGAGDDRKKLEMELEQQVVKLQQIIPEYIFGYDGISLEESVGRLLKEKGLTVSTAESCTGGNISRMIVSVPGSSEYYAGSIIAYSNEIKSSALGVDSDIIQRNGAVSREVAMLMASGAASKLGTDFGVAVTGVAGPSGGTDEKPVGTTWIAVAGPHGVEAGKFTFGEFRDINIRRASLAALSMLRKQIINC